MNLKRLIGRLLNPTSNVASLPSLAAIPAVEEAPDYGQSRLRLRHILTNAPLMLGALIILGLFTIVLFGPLWAPQNPYISGQHIVPHFDAEKGEFIRPPLPPSEEFPLGTDQWGNDILSLLMHGARNTLVACAFITMARILLGLALGAIAGWQEGKTPDKIIMGAVSILTSLPLLISTIILIYALDIRQGLPVFIVALSIIGWAEIAQYIRSEFLVLRQKPFIEGAHATGLTGVQTAVRHILPNILPQLLIITFLEMGAVLMLLGELGFVGVFIGGGSRIDIGDDFGGANVFTLMDVPEWGAMIAEGARWLRSKPFVVFPPAAAFFVAVLGFNSLGEGLRRLIENRGLSTSFLLRKRMLLVITAVTLAAIFIMNNTGAAPWFARVAQAFDGGRVQTHLETLNTLSRDSETSTAVYITEQFQQNGLEPGWRDDSYHYLFETTLVHATEEPSFTLLDPSGGPGQTYRHRQDFGFMIEGHGGSGQVTAPVTFVGFGDHLEDLTWESYRNLDLRGQIVMLVAGNAPAAFPTEALIRGAVGVLWITDNSVDAVRSQIQFADPREEYLRRPEIPTFRIRPHVADDILQEAGLNLNTLFSADAPPTQMGDGWFTRETDTAVSLSLSLSPPRTVEIPSILGYIPGSDFDLADELVVFFVVYDDGQSLDPDAPPYPAGADNAAGVSLMLEVARLWHEQELDARRSTMFVVWGGGQLEDSGLSQWIGDRFNFRHLRTSNTRVNVRPTILIQLDQTDPDGNTLITPAPAGDRLEDLVRSTAAQTTLSLQTGLELDRFSDQVLTGQMPNWIAMRWTTETEGAESGDAEETTGDNGEIAADRLQTLGEMLTLTLTSIVRETSY